MILESQYWKNDLAQNVVFLHDKLHQKVWRDASFAALEKRIMLSCYIVRKLAESKKITKELFQQDITLYAYKNRGVAVDLLNSHKIQELYEVEKPQQIVKPFSYVVNQIIHSYTFIPTFQSKNELKGCLFNSDRSKKHEIYLLRIIDFIEALSPIAQCYVGVTIMQRNSDGEMVVVQSE